MLLPEKESLRLSVLIVGGPLIKLADDKKGHSGYGHKDTK